MPEGHSIHRAARRIGAAIAGHALTRVEARGPELLFAKAQQRLAGQTLERAEARGKHLLLHFSGGWSVHSHLRMDGAWHTYRVGERWRMRAHRAWLMLEANGWTAVQFDGPILELHATGDLLRDGRITRLGPDILAAEFDDGEYLRRLREAPDLELGEAVLQQRLVAGIGNIYKNETLFLTGLSPWRLVGETTDEQLLDVRRTATRIMQDGILDPRTITFRGPGAPGQWVYGRAGLPCRRCAAPLDSCPQGADQRITWWCDRCQS